MSTPLEDFLLRYVETVGGIWQPAEPQVYDVLLPPEIERQLELPTADGTIRLAFDPEAVADYPSAHLMVFGNPTLDRIFQHAQSLGQIGRVYLGGYNLTPHDLPALLRRNLQTPEGMSIQVVSARVYHYPSALQWFQSTFISDEKEQVTFSVGIDLHYGRFSRHLQQLLRDTAAGRGYSTAESRPAAYPDATSISLTQAYALAREEVIRTVTVAAHARLADLQRHLQHETQRITRYFTDLRTELDERRGRAMAKDPQTDVAQFDQQREALNREEQAQLTELRRKMSLRVEVKLLNVLLVVQPKLDARIRLAPQKGTAGETHVVWDPATQKPEAWPCPSCGRPTLALSLDATGTVVCADCAQASAGQRSRTVKRG